MTALLYLTTVLIWGTTWIAIKWELGAAPIPLSVALRFAIAAAVLFAILAARRAIVRPRGEALRLVAAQGLCLFCCNFLCFYNATRWVPSGLVAVIFSMATIMNAVNARLFFGQRIAPRVMAGGVLGLAGIFLLFAQEIMRALTLDALYGWALALLGTLLFSFGNMLSSRLQRLGHAPLQTNAWAMLIGAGVLLLGSAAAGVPFALAPTPRYLGALLYLAIPGSVIGFTAYLMLVGRLGAERAAYTTVLFPLVALNVSAWFEGYRWTPLALLGVALVLGGNLLVFSRRTRAPTPVAASRVLRPDAPAQAPD
jgi:drug/metabolite transporter (DMT)-like permease